MGERAAALVSVALQNAGQDTAAAHLSFASGAMGTWYSAWAVKARHGHTAIDGREGTLVIEGNTLRLKSTRINDPDFIAGWHEIDVTEPARDVGHLRGAVIIGLDRSVLRDAFRRHAPEPVDAHVHDGRAMPVHAARADRVFRRGTVHVACLPAIAQQIPDVLYAIVGEGEERPRLEELIAYHAVALFYPHGVGHLLGLDVHDMEDLGDRAGYAPGRERAHNFGDRYLRLDRDLAPGMCVTIEPGFYQISRILERPSEVGELEAEGEGVVGVEVAGVDQVRGEVALRPRLVADPVARREHVAGAGNFAASNDAVSCWTRT